MAAGYRTFYKARSWGLNGCSIRWLREDYLADFDGKDDNLFASKRLDDNLSNHGNRWTTTAGREHRKGGQVDGVANIEKGATVN